MERNDPIGDKHYIPLQKGELFSSILFSASLSLTISLLVIEKDALPSVYSAIQIAFIVTAVSNAILGFTIRLYFSPRASEKRQQDLLSNSFSVPLAHDRSTGYYNNKQTSPILRLGASIMESAMFTAAVLREMLFWTRIQTAAYAVLFLVLISARQTDLGLFGISAQVLFGEQVLSRYIRMEWLRAQSESVSDALHALFAGAGNAASDHTQARILAQYSKYESAKANTAIPLSSRHFRKLNPVLSREWDRIRDDLSI